MTHIICSRIDKHVNIQVRVNIAINTISNDSFTFKLSGPCSIQTISRTYNNCTINYQKYNTHGRRKCYINAICVCALPYIKILYKFLFVHIIKFYSPQNDKRCSKTIWTSLEQPILRQFRSLPGLYETLVS